jgi:hypothetical protein
MVMWPENTVAFSPDERAQGRAACVQSQTERELINNN